MKKSIICATVATSLLTASCATDNGPSNNQMLSTGGGALLGGLAGRLIGGNNTGMLIGAAVGALAGAAFGTYLDQREKEAMDKATAAAAANAKTGERITWSAPAASQPQAAAAPSAPVPDQAAPQPAADTPAKPIKAVKASAPAPKPAPVPAAAPQPQASAAAWSVPPAATPAPDAQAASAPSASAGGWIIPTSDPYRTADGRTCRDLKQVATKNGDTREQAVTACKGAAGEWQIPS